MKLHASLVLALLAVCAVGATADAIAAADEQELGNEGAEAGSRTLLKDGHDDDDYYRRGGRKPCKVRPRDAGFSTRLQRLVALRMVRT